MKALDRTRATEQVDATWLETDPGPPRSPGVSAIRSDQRANAGRSESEAVECSNLDTEDRPNRGRTATFVKNYASRKLGDVRVVEAWLVNLGGFQSRPACARSLEQLLDC
jgi:hypothetical protein